MKPNQFPVKESQASGRPEGGDFFVPTPGWLTLGDGTSFAGTIPKDQAQSLIGEVVFNTGMTGYVETLTDPSYTGQILVFTFPLIGNYGVMDEKFWESTRIHLRGVVMSELSLSYSHTGAVSSLLSWLKAQGVPVMTGADTRAITRHLRSRGVMPGIIGTTKLDASRGMQIARVLVPEPRTYNAGAGKRILALDCGMKENIIRNLTARGLEIVRQPHTQAFNPNEFDGIFISNGPGDPADYPEAIANLKAAISTNVPIFGICLGAQLLALAAGGSTYKLKFGHRGHNQPVQFENGHAYITSQNHGYAIDQASLPGDWRVTFTNLNDGSVEGIAHATKPFFAVQFHPEAAPGPTDTGWLFDAFVENL